MPTRIKKAKFRTIEQIVASVAEIVRPPDRITVTEAAERHRWINNPGNYVGPYRSEKSPYIREPGEVLTSREYTAMIFVGPAQAGKTEPVMNWVTYSAMYDPTDLMIISPTLGASRDFSKRRIGKLLRDTKELKNKLPSGRKAQNVFDVTFTNGMYLTLSHPSISELSGKPIPHLWLTDYDRMDMDVDGEGSPFDLAAARATTFRRHGMTVAESTPGFMVENPSWMPSFPHEAPPTAGILGLYNRGDRRRWFWPCPDCGEPFEPSFEHMVWPDLGNDFLAMAERAQMKCPHCGSQIDHKHKYELNLAGRWIPAGVTWMKGGELRGKPIRTSTASFWLKGPAAGFATWEDITMKYLLAEDEYIRTGNEEPLKVAVNTAHGEAYTPKAMQAERLPEDLKNQAEDWGGTEEEPVVPEGVRFLVATVDVQAGMRPSFVVHVYGIGRNRDVWHIDMFKIRKSVRTDEDGTPDWLDPAAYPEDWDRLVTEVIEKTYPLNDDSGRRMQIKMTGCDSGGKAGVTTNAYNFWRRLKSDEQKRGYHLRFQLLKGVSSKTAPRYKRDYPDAQRKDRNAGARGDVPVGFINSDPMKDQVYAMLGRTDPDGGMIHYPKWAPDWLYTQLTAEHRTTDGWKQVKGKRNEAFDLLYYCLALLLDSRIKAEHIDWDKPPGWADKWDKNDLIFHETKGPGMLGKAKKKVDLKSLGERLG